jgi:hypothetical protein
MLLAEQDLLFINGRAVRTISILQSVGAATSAGFTPTALTQTTYYRRGASTASDDIQYTGSVTVTVQQSIGGTVTGSATMCSGTNQTVLHLTGYTGTIVKWQSSPVNNFSSGVTDLVETTADLNLTNLASTVSTTTYYRAVVQIGKLCFSKQQSGLCYSEPITKCCSNPTSVAITRGQSVTLVASGANSYVWGPSTNLSAANTASVTASPTNTAQANVYTVTGTDGNGCVNTASVTITVNPRLPQEL